MGQSQQLTTILMTHCKFSTIFLLIVFIINNIDDIPTEQKLTPLNKLLCPSSGSNPKHCLDQQRQPMNTFKRLEPRKVDIFINKSLQCFFFCVGGEINGFLQL